MDISVIGAGYVGLVTCACLAYLGNHVIAVDSNKEKLASLKQGRAPFYEPGLDQFLTESIESGFLEFSDSIEAAVKRSQVGQQLTLRKTQFHSRLVSPKVSLFQFAAV